MTFSSFVQSFAWYSVDVVQGGYSVTSTSFGAIRAFLAQIWAYKFGISIIALLFLSNIVFISYQTEIMTTSDIFYECGLMPLCDWISNFVTVTLKNIYVWLIERTNDIIAYMRQCITDAVEQIGDIGDADEIFTLNGLTEVMDIVWDAVVCISEYAYKVPSIRVRYLTDFFQPIFEWLICGANVCEDLIYVIIRGTIFSEDCTWCKDFDPHKNCPLVANAAPGITPDCENNCHNFEQEFYGCTATFIDAFFDAIEPVINWNPGHFFDDLFDALACIVSLYKRPFFAITGLLTGCIDIEDIEHQLVAWMEDTVLCWGELIIVISDGEIEEFFVFAFKWLFSAIQSIIDSVTLIVDCGDEPNFTNCINDYPSNCEENGLIATGGLETCYDVIVDCWDDPVNVLMEPLFFIDFFDIFRIIPVIIDTVVCPFYNLVECMSRLPSNCDFACLANGFKCLANFFNILEIFSTATDGALWLFGAYMDTVDDLVSTVNKLIKEVNSLAKAIEDIWADINPFKKKKHIHESSEFMENISNNNNTIGFYKNGKNRRTLDDIEQIRKSAIQSKGYYNNIKLRLETESELQRQIKIFEQRLDIFDILLLPQNNEDECFKNIYFNEFGDRYAIMKLEYKQKCDIGYHLKKFIICFIDGGVCNMDAYDYDKLIFYEYNNYLMEDSLVFYADYIWVKVLNNLGIEYDEQCYEKLNQGHPLKYLRDNKAYYNLCMKKYMKANNGQISYKALNLNLHQKHINSIKNENNQITKFDYKSKGTFLTNLVDMNSLVQNGNYKDENELMLYFIKGFNERIQETKEKLNGKSVIQYIVDKMYNRYTNSEYAKIIKEYNIKRELLKNYYFDEPYDRVAFETYRDEINALIYYNGTDPMPNTEEHDKLQKQLLMNELFKIKDVFYASQEPRRIGCSKYNNVFKHCRKGHRYNTSPSKYSNSADSSLINKFQSDSMVEINLNDNDIFDHENMESAPTREMIESYNNWKKEKMKQHKAAQKIRHAASIVYNSTKDYNITKVISFIDHNFRTNIKDWNVIKIPYAIFHSMNYGQYKELVQWFQGQKAYSIDKSFHDVPKEEEGGEEEEINYEKVESKMENNLKKIKEIKGYIPSPILGWKTHKVKPFINSYYNNYTIFNLSKLENEQEEMNTTYFGISYNKIRNVISSINKTDDKITTDYYNVTFILSNGTTVTKQYVTSFFNFNDAIITAIDWTISLFSGLENYVKNVYDNFVDSLANLDYQEYAESNIIDYIKFLLTCHVPENYDGTYLYNPLCFPFLPEDILDWIQYVPNSRIPLQIPWPEELIKTPCVNVYNGEHGLLDYRQSNNCPNNDGFTRPFCDSTPQCDYCQKEYYTCKAIGFQNDALDPFLYLFATLPSLLNYLYFGTMPIRTAQFIAISMSLFTVFYIGPFVVIVIIILMFLFWGISILTPVMPVAFVVFAFTILAFLYFQALLNLVAFFYTLIVIFLITWVLFFLFQVNPFNVNIIQAAIDTTNWINVTPPFSTVLPDLTFLVTRFERFNYGFGEIPYVDTFCFIWNYGNFFAGLVIALVSYYILYLLAMAGWFSGTLITSFFSRWKAGRNSSQYQNNVSGFTSTPGGDDGFGVVPTPNLLNIAQAVNSNANDNFESKRTNIIIPKSGYDPEVNSYASKNNNNKKFDNNNNNNNNHDGYDNIIHHTAVIPRVDRVDLFPQETNHNNSNNNNISIGNNNNNNNNNNNKKQKKSNSNENATKQKTS
jgi:hypothetical protein